MKDPSGNAGCHAGLIPITFEIADPLSAALTPFLNEKQPGRDDALLPQGLGFCFLALQELPKLHGEGKLPWLSCSSSFRTQGKRG